jgi:hypothetical protein
MKMQDIRIIARGNGVSPGKMLKADLIRAIQRAEGNFDCFGTAVEEECDQESCLWQEDCFFESVVEEMVPRGKEVGRLTKETATR